MKKRRMAGAIPTSLLIALVISGCATDGMNTERQSEVRGEAVHSSGWVGVEVAYKMQGWIPGHTIVSVAEGTPASRAGLMAGDEITYVNEGNAGYMTTQEVVRRLREADPQVVLLVKRKGQKDFLPFTMTRADASSGQAQGTPKTTTVGAGLTQSQVPSKSAAAAVSPSKVKEPSRAATTPLWDRGMIKNLFAPAKGQESSKGRVYWGITRTIDTPEGVVILEIETPSALSNAAAGAGLYPGDIILEVDGLPVRTSKDLKEKIRMSRPYTPVNILVQQSGHRVEKTILPRGVVRVEVHDVDRSFVIPGAAQPVAVRPSSAVDALENINVLKEVIIDRASGQIQLTGSYDPKYGTGPIPYLDLLKTALKYPEPLLNLIKEESTKEQELPSNKKNVYGVNEVRVLLGMPAADRERQLLIREISARCGITREEWARLYNYSHLEAEGRLAPPEVGRIVVKICRHLGYDEVAAAYEQLAGNSADHSMQALRMLGKETLAQKFLTDKSTETKQTESRLLALACIAMIERLDHRPPAEIARLVSLLETSGEKSGQIVDQMYRVAALSLKDKTGHSLLGASLGRVPVGDAPTRIFYGAPHPALVRIETTDVDPHSQLTRILYEADYAGKSFLLRPDLFEGIPGQITYSEYLGRKTKGMGSGDGAKLYLDASFWFEPKRVEMEVSPDGNVVSFGASEILFTTRMEKASAGSPEEAEKLMTLNRDWCAQYTENYELYARAMPAFHNLRELSKVIAFARWLNSEEIGLNLDSVQNARWENPGKVPGSWRWFAVYAEIAPGKFLLHTGSGITGGVSFRQKTNWNTACRCSQNRLRGQRGRGSENRLSDRLGW